jgi:hypothetical protein
MHVMISGCCWTKIDSRFMNSGLFVLTSDNPCTSTDEQGAPSQRNLSDIQVQGNHLINPKFGCQRALSITWKSSVCQINPVTRPVKMSRYLTRRMAGVLCRVKVCVIIFSRKSELPQTTAMQTTSWIQGMRDSPVGPEIPFVSSFNIQPLVDRSSIQACQCMPVR